MKTVSGVRCVDGVTVVRFVAARANSTSGAQRTNECICSLTQAARQGHIPAMYVARLAKPSAGGATAVASRGSP